MNMVGNILVQLLGLLVVFGLAWLLFFWLIRRRGWTPTGQRYGSWSFQPASAPPLARVARVVDAAVLGGAAAVILAVVATTTHTGGLLLMLDQLPPSFATANLVMFACAVVGVALAVLVVLGGRTFIGALLLASVLVTYGLVLNGGSYPGSWFLPKSVINLPVVRYTVTPGGLDIPGAELWVNGVFLGPTPYKASPEEFKAAVPEWLEPPEDYETSQTEIVEYRQWGPSTRTYKTWIRFEPPSFVTNYSRQEFGTKLPAMPACYAKVRYAGEWALADGSSGSGGPSGGTYRREAYNYFNVLLPLRGQRLDNLLNQARLMDYRVDDAWLDALETYGRDGWNALQKMIATEPEMTQVLVAWANRRCGLDQAVDAQSAWRVFQNISKTADRAGSYTTDSIEGFAVGQLSPLLSTEQLVDAAVDMIRRTRHRNYAYSFGQFYSGRTWFGTWDPLTDTSLPPRAFVLAQAVWLLHQRLEASGGPNPIQERIVPALICWRGEQGHGFDDIIGRLGGPAAFTWFVRHDWRMRGDTPGRLSYENTVHIGSASVNRWMYQLANFRGPLGREFRTVYAHDVMRFADDFMASPGIRIDMEHLEFLFLDRGQDSLAMQYWPRFKNHVVGSNLTWERLEVLLEYLIRMEPVSTPQQYVDAWRAALSSRPYERSNAIEKLTALPLAKRQAVIDAIRADVEQDPRFAAGGSEASWREHLPNWLDEPLVETDETRLMFDRLAARDNDRRYSRENIRLWLEHTEPHHPLVERLAAADDPDLRLMTMGALRTHATPARRRLLEQLADDPNPAVRDAARAVQTHLKTLAAESPSRYASNTPTDTTPSVIILPRSTVTAGGTWNYRSGGG